MWSSAGEGWREARWPMGPQEAAHYRGGSGGRQGTFEVRTCVAVHLIIQIAIHGQIVSPSTKVGTLDPHRDVNSPHGHAITDR